MRAKLKVKSFINGGVHDAGEILDVDELDGRLEALDDAQPAKKDEGKHKKSSKDAFDGALDD